VRIATMEGIGSFYLAPRMPRLRQAFPDILIELVTERHLINLTRREADISLSFAELQGPRLIAEKIGTFVLNLYASPAYIARMGMPASIADLEGHEFVDYIDDMVVIPPRLDGCTTSSRRPAWSFRARAWSPSRMRRQREWG
jgi:DNA-binding transcriptional LysR family regulator